MTSFTNVNTAHYCQYSGQDDTIPDATRTCQRCKLCLLQVLCLKLFDGSLVSREWSNCHCHYFLSIYNHLKQPGLLFSSLSRVT